MHVFDISHCIPTQPVIEETEARKVKLDEKGEGEPEGLMLESFPRELWRTTWNMRSCPRWSSA